jgi:hypothetical protein
MFPQIELLNLIVLLRTVTPHSSGDRPSISVSSLSLRNYGAFPRLLRMI